MLNNHFNSIFLSNKYSMWYYNIINAALQENRKKINKNSTDYIYYESHHIIPKSIRPEFKDLKLNLWNKVLLTPKEHFICHLLLTKMLVGAEKNKMVYALWSMTNQKNKDQIRFHSNLYSFYKIKMKVSMSSERKGKSLIDLYGESRAAEIKKNMESRITRNEVSESEKLNISLRIKQASKDSPWTRNFELKQPGNKTCEKCNITCDLGNYTRHHGEKCKRIQKSCPKCLSTFFTTPHENKKSCCRNFKKDQHTDAFEDLI